MIKSNLEPIEESDLDLESKLTPGNPGAQHEEKPVFNVEQEQPHEISAAEKDSAYGSILSKVQTQQTDDQTTDVSQDAQAVYQKADAGSQVQHLVDIAMQKGVPHAVNVARHMEDNYVLDTFHDKLLANELRDALAAKGLIEEI